MTSRASTDAGRWLRLVADVLDLETMTEFRLYDGATARQLGAYRTHEAAYAAADEHSLVALAEAGEWVSVDHWLVYVDATGRIEVASELTHVGPPDDLDGCREWLRSLPGRSGAAPD